MAKRLEDSVQGLVAIVYGEPGTGKTTLMGSTCDDERYGRVLDLDVFGNPIVLNQRVRQGLPIPDVIQIQSLEDFNEPYWWFEKGQPEDDPYAKKFKLEPPYSTIWIDGTTEVQRFITGLITGSLNTPPGALLGILGRQGFGQLLATMMNWAKHYIALSELGYNIFFSCLEADKKDEQQRSSFEPLIWGQTGLELCGYALLVGRLTTKLRTDPEIRGRDKNILAPSTFNVLQVLPTTNSYAKDQYGCGVTHIINPTMPALLDLIQGTTKQGSE